MNKYFDSENVTYKQVDSELTNRKRKSNDLSEYVFYKNSVNYDKKGGSASSLMHEATVNYGIAKSSRRIKDVVEKMLIEEFDMGNRPDLKDIVKQCTQCVKDIQVWKNNNKDNEAKFEGNFSNEVTECALIIENKLKDVQLGSDANRRKKVNKEDNKYLLKPMDFLVYNLATSEEANFQFTDIVPAETETLKDFVETYEEKTGKELNLKRIIVNNAVVDKSKLNDALIIDNEFSLTELPDNYNIYSSPTSSSDNIALTANSTNKNVVTYEQNMPVMSIVYPVTELDANKNAISINYAEAFENAKQNLIKKYPNLKINVTERNVENMSSGYVNKKKEVSVNVNFIENEASYSNAPKNIINTIFQAERAYNEVTLKDINKTLEITSKTVATKNGLKKDRKGLKSGKVTARELIPYNVTSIHKEYKINSSAELVQRAIAIGATINTLKLNGYLNPDATRASCLFLQSQFNKTISLLTNNSSLWVMPYITKKIATSFEREVQSQSLTKKQVIEKFAENGMPVVAHESFTLSQIAFAKPDREAQRQAIAQKIKAKQQERAKQKEQEALKEIKKEAEKAEKQQEKEAKKKEKEEKKRQAIKEKWRKKLRKTSVYKKAKVTLHTINIDKVEKNFSNLRVFNERIDVKHPTLKDGFELRKQFKPEPIKVKLEELQSKRNQIKEILDKEPPVEPEPAVEPKIAKVKSELDVKNCIERKVKKLILQAREKVTAKIDNKRKNVTETKKSDNLMKAYNFSAVFADTLGAEFNGKPRVNTPVKQVNQEVVSEVLETFKKQALNLTDDYSRLVKMIVDDVYREYQKADEGVSVARLINQILSNYKPSIENILSQDLMDLYNIKLPQKKLLSHEEFKVDIMLGENLNTVRRAKEYEQLLKEEKENN